MDEVVTQFFLETCEIERKIDKRTLLLSGLFYDEFAISAITGSVAELYIEPILSCISDIDIMSRNGKVVAIPAGHRIR